MQNKNSRFVCVRRQLLCSRIHGKFRLGSSECPSAANILCMSPERFCSAEPTLFGSYGTGEPKRNSIIQHVRPIIYQNKELKSVKFLAC
jgi:hypothetical protein